MSNIHLKMRASPALAQSFPNRPRRHRSSIWALALAAPLLFSAGSAWAQVDLLVNHEVDPADMLPAGSTFTYRAITRLNLGDSATGVTLTEVLPVGVRFQSVTAPVGVSCAPLPAPNTLIAESNRTIECAIGNMGPVEDFHIVDFTVTIPEVGTSWRASASVSSNETDISPPNGQGIQRDVTTTVAADLGITLTGPSGPVTQFQPFSYTATVTNNGPSAIPVGGSVVTTFTVPAGLTGSTPTGTGWSCTPAASNQPAGTLFTCSYAATSGVARDATLPALSIPVTPQVSGSVDATVNVQGRYPNNDPFPDAVVTNNTAITPITIGADNVVDVRLSKTANPTVVDTDGLTNVAYTLSVRRLSGADAPAGLTVVDTLPTGVAYTGSSGAGWSCPAAPAGPTISCTFSGVAPSVGSDYPALVINTTVAAGLAAGATPENVGRVSASNECNTCDSNNTDEATVTASDTVNLTVSKTRSRSPVQVDESYTYTIGVRNNGQIPVRPGQTVTVVDNVPAHVRITAATADWTCAPLPITGPGDLTCTYNGGIPGNSTQNLELTAVVQNTLPAGNYATIGNTAEVTGVVGRGTTGRLTGSVDINVSPLAADLSITKTTTSPDSKQVDSGDLVTYTLVVTNNATNGQRSTGITVTDDLTNLVTSDHGRPRLPNGDYVPDTTGTWPQGGFASANVVINGNGTSCTNGNGNGAASGSATSTSRTYTCTGMALDPGASATITLQARHFVPNVASSGDVFGTHTNIARVASSQVRDTDTTNNQDDDTVDIRPFTDLTVHKVPTPDNPRAGEPVTYTIHVQNLGPSTAQGVTLNDPLPANGYWIGGAPTVSNGGNCTYPTNGAQGGTLNCSWPAGLPNDSQYSVSYQLRSATDAAENTTLVNTATVATTTQETNPDNNSDDATVTLRRPELDVRINMEHTLDAIELGTETEYTIRVTNNGPSFATNVNMTDVFPGVLQPSGAPSTATFQWKGALAVTSSNPSSTVALENCTAPAMDSTTGPLVCNFALLAPGEVVSIRFRMKAHDLPAGAQVGTIFHNATVTAPDENLVDPSLNVLANNATADRTSTRRAGVDPDDIEQVDLSLNKEGTSSALINPGDRLKGGETVVYTLTVRNEETDPARVSTNGVVTDVLPAGLTFGSAPGCTHVAETRTVTCPVGTLNPGQTRDFTVTVTVSTPYTGARPLVNSATVNALGDPNPGNNTDDNELPFDPPPATAIPTLSEWALIALSMLLAAFALRNLPLTARRRM